MRNSSRFMALACGLGLLTASLSGTARAEGIQSADAPIILAQAQATGPEGFAPWLAAFKERARDAGISEATIKQALNGTRYHQQIVNLDRKQSDFTRTIGGYLDRAVSTDRITAGKKALSRHRALLDRIAQHYGVPKETVVAIWGLETNYGSYRGKSSTIRSLATLAYDGRRSAFFERELIEALKILDNGDITLGKMVGSWAGAMGHTQFMPSSFNKYAVDFDGNGRRNVWSKDPTDALASAAAYLKHFGWQTEQPWAVEVQLPQGFDLMRANPGVQKTAQDWAALGVRPVGEGTLEGFETATLFLPAGYPGPILMVAENFEAIRRYNITPTYIMAVGLLSDALAGGSRTFTAPWPAEARLLSLAERKDMQSYLHAAGYDPGRQDGKIDAGFIAALQAYQTAQGVPPDGFPSATLLKRLRAN